MTSALARITSMTPARSISTPTARPAYSVLDNTALDAALAGFAPVPRRSWEAALEAVLDARLGPLTETAP